MFTSRRIATMGGDKFRDEFSLAFDGTNDYVDCGPSNALITGNNVTFSCWAKVTDTDRGYIFSNARDNTSSNFSLQVNRDGASGDTAGYITAIVYTGSVTAYTIYDGNIDDSQWHHYALTTTASAQVLYLDGVAVATSSNTFSNSAAANYNTLIGNLIGTSNYFGGNISEVALYNSTLSASQVKTLYNGREPYNHKEGIASGNLKAWWRMGDGRLDATNAYEGGVVSDDSQNSYLGPDLVDDVMNASNWVAWGTNTVELESGAIKITYDNNASGAYFYLRDSKGLTTDLTVGKTYKVSYKVKVNTGSSVTTAISEEGGFGAGGGATTSTTYEDKVIYIACSATQDHYFYAGSMGSGEIVYYTDIKIQEVVGNTGVIVNMDNNQFSGDTP